MVLITVCVEMGKTSTDTSRMIVLTTLTMRTMGISMVTLANPLLGVNQDKIVNTIVVTIYRRKRKTVHQIEGEDLVQGLTYSSIQKRRWQTLKWYQWKQTWKFC